MRNRVRKNLGFLLAVGVMLTGGIRTSWGQMGGDIGGYPWPPTPGSYTFDGTSWTVTGGGWAHLNYPYFDQCHYVFLPMEGDGEFVARLVSLSGSDEWARAGIMIRESRNPCWKMVFLSAAVNRRGILQNRLEQYTNANAGYTELDTITLPVWLKLVRGGDMFAGYVSEDGENWSLMEMTYHEDGGGSSTNPIEVQIPDPVYIGLAVTSHTTDTVATAVFDHVSFDVKHAQIPKPTDGSINVLTDCILRWSPPAYVEAPLYDVYLGVDSSASMLKVADGQTELNFDPPGNLQYGKTYYWRVDVREGETVHTGNVWSFNTEAGMALIPAGEFLMGDSYEEGYEDELPVHTVYIDAFFIGRFEVTCRQYCEALNWAKNNGLVELHDDGAVYQAGTNEPYCVTTLNVDNKWWRLTYDGYQFGIVPGKEDFPMLGVTWCGAAAYCNWRSEMEGREPCYQRALAECNFNNNIWTRMWQCDFANNGYRLPTEAEWEYAARGGLVGKRYPWGDDIDDTLANYYGVQHPWSGPWHYSEDLPMTPVGFFNGRLRYTEEFDDWPGSWGAIEHDRYQTSNGANGYGLYDVAGNVWEWCHDISRPDYYNVSPYSNPTGPEGAQGPIGVIIRGGHGGPIFLRVAKRSGPYHPHSCWLSLTGLRVVYRGTPPIADAGVNVAIPSVAQVSTVIDGTASDADGDSLEYRWLEGETVLLGWTVVGEDGEASLNLGTLPYFSVGNHTLTLEVREAKEGGLAASDDMILTVQNSPPEAQPAPSDQVVEIGVDPIKVVADVADFDGDPVTYQWLRGSEVLASGSIRTVQGGDPVLIPDLYIAEDDARFPVGVYQIELKVSDGINSPVSSFVSVEVTDTTSPSISPVPSVTILWPPNHELQAVTIAANALDNGGGAITLAVTVVSSDPPNASGDGSTIPDYYIDSINNATGIIELRLRSERAGTGDGRSYTVRITATDQSGNASEAVVTIRAPHDKRKK